MFFEISGAALPSFSRALCALSFMGRFASLFQAVASLPSFNEAFRLLVSYEKLGSFSSSIVGGAGNTACFCSYIYNIVCLYNMVCRYI